MTTEETSTSRAFFNLKTGDLVSTATSKHLVLRRFGDGSILFGELGDSKKLYKEKNVQLFGTKLRMLP